MYHWDLWHTQALARGVGQELAQVGRELLRDHAQHGLDSGQLGDVLDMPLMLELAAQVPITAYHRFQGDIAAHNGADCNRDMAFELLVEKMGSEGTVEEALAKEKPLAEQIWRQYGDVLRSQ